MLEKIAKEVWAFDLEWVPDAHAGRMLYGAQEARSESDVLAVMWERGGATIEEPRPYLKTVLCRVVSIAAVRRSSTPSGVTVDLLSVPADVDDAIQLDEREMLKRFFGELRVRRPQLVGYNSAGADLSILIQRAVVHGIPAHGLFEGGPRPALGNVAWPGGDHVDLMRALGGRGRSTPSLHEVATLSGIPGKMDIDGGDVARLWLEGRRRRIVDYNEFDAVTTYLLWLRVARAAGAFTARTYAIEEERVRALLEEKSSMPSGTHFRRYLSEWARLASMHGAPPVDPRSMSSNGTSPSSPVSTVSCPS